MFSLNPEEAHELTLQVAKLSPALGKLTGTPPSEAHRFQLGSLLWTFPVGLAAGLDKNAEALPFFDAQGFGAIECGTITKMPQLGNPKPRIFRYPNEESLRNSMGFPNQGYASILPRLKHYQGRAPIGVNIGKNKDSSAEQSIRELSLLVETLTPYTDYFVVNVSSPNTPGLRELQDKTYLTELFTQLKQTKTTKLKDMYLKLSPDLSREKVLELGRLASEMKISGIIATNTTIMPERGIGGVSGNLLKDKSADVRKNLLLERFPIEVIGVGGISSAKDLFNFWYLGGKAVQVYTSYIYQGPKLLKHFSDSIDLFLKNEKITNLSSFFKMDEKEKQKILLPYL